jgi:hypothetical protein
VELHAPTPNAAANETESWNGTSWTELATDLNQARSFLGGTGINTLQL